MATTTPKAVKDVYRPQGLAALATSDRELIRVKTPRPPYAPRSPAALFREENRPEAKTRAGAPI